MTTIDDMNDSHALAESMQYKFLVFLVTFTTRGSGERRRMIKGPSVVCSRIPFVLDGAHTKVRQRMSDKKRRKKEIILGHKGQMRWRRF